jgi:hypothetical protein
MISGEPVSKRPTGYTYFFKDEVSCSVKPMPEYIKRWLQSSSFFAETVECLICCEAKSRTNTGIGCAGCGNMVCKECAFNMAKCPFCRHEFRIVSV